MGWSSSAPCKREESVIKKRRVKGHMFKRFTNGCVRVVNRWLPDAFLFAVILTIVVFIGALAATGLPVFTAAKTEDGKPMLDLISAWGNSNGFWSLLSFSMQMALVLVLGSACASAKPFKALLR